jgi:cytochrome c oxidase subunit 4
MTSEAQAGHGAAHRHPNYMAIFWWLLALTIVEIAAGMMLQRVGRGPARLTLICGLILMAAAKAALVAMYFMHLRFEKRTLAIIAGTPIVLLVFLMLMLMPDALRTLHNRAEAGSASAPAAAPTPAP